MSDLIFSSLFVTLNRFHTLFGVSTVDFKQVIPAGIPVKCCLWRPFLVELLESVFFLIGIHSTQGQTATARD